MRKTTAVFFLLFVFYCANAQQKQLSLDKLTVDKGLPDNFPRTVVQDDHGYIWVGTFSGLVRYDGYEAEVYSLNKNAGSEKDYDTIDFLFMNHKGELWVLAGRDGLFRYNQTSGDFIQYNLKLAIKQYRHIRQIQVLSQMMPFG